MRDDFDEVVADQFTLLDQVPVPDTWSQVRSKALGGSPIEFTDAFEQDMAVSHLEASSPPDLIGSRHRWMATATAAAALVLVVAGAVVFSQRDSGQPTAVTAPISPDTTTGVAESPFAAAIESAGTLTTPSAEDIALATDTSLHHTDTGSTQVSAAANFAVLRTCRPVPPEDGAVVGRATVPESACGSGVGYVTGSVDGGEVYRGWLGDADRAELFVLDDRFFVAMDTSPGAQQAPTAWLIDSESGTSADLTWRDEPTTMNSPEQALVAAEGLWTVARNAYMAGTYQPGFLDDMFLPRVVDARDGTIRPLAVPANASANVPVGQDGRGRIWVGTSLDGHALGEEDDDAVQAAGFAYTDDGGATWTEVTIPEAQFANERLATRNSAGVSTAADGDHIAVTSAWSYNDERYVYVSSDAGQTWSTLTVANPQEANGAHLYVLADGRLMLVQSDDPYVNGLLVSTAAGWTDLERNEQASRASTYVSVNRDGIAFRYFPIEIFGDGTIGGMPDAPPNRHQFSTDLTSWQTVPVPDD